jgi:hypothetical protein|tara:strand:+ start:44 stop:628 length:585 start_codon:yes stop_codon:yes gene_type:complete
MGAFETFVNANLGIRKPLITDVGHPTGSASAAGIVGSQYIDSSNNHLYEKIGENNQVDWNFVRVLGDSASGSASQYDLDQLSLQLTGVYQDVTVVEQEVNNLQSLVSGQAASTFSSSMEVPVGIDKVDVPFIDIGNSGYYSSAPVVVSSMRFNSAPEFLYAHANYEVTPTGFKVLFSSDIIETGTFLDIIIDSN